MRFLAGRWSALCCLALLAACFVVSPASAGRVLVLETMDVPVVTEGGRAVARGLSELPGVVVVRRNAAGDKARARELVRRELDAGGLDLVVGVATLASQAAHEVLAGSGVPLVFCTVSDPVGAGLVEAVGEPSGTNVAGQVFSIPKAVEVDLVMGILGSGKIEPPVHLGLVYSDYPSSVSDARALKELARERGDFMVEERVFPYDSEERGYAAMLAQARRAVSELRDRVDWWWEVSGPLGERDELTRLLLSSGRPVAFGNTLGHVEMGALVGLALDVERAGAEVAAMAARVLFGEDPGEMVVSTPRGFVMGINLDTAVHHGLTVSSDLLETADHVYRR